MGVSLSLEGPRQSRGRRRGQHTRSAEEQASLDALAAFLHSDAMTAGRCLSRVSRESLVAQLLPAARALARAAELVLASEPDAISGVANDFVVSRACLLGKCEGSAAISPCVSPTCQHDCHRGAYSLPSRPGPAMPLAAPVFPEATIPPRSLSALAIAARPAGPGPATAEPGAAPQKRHLALVRRRSL